MGPGWNPFNTGYRLGVLKQIRLPKLHSRALKNLKNLKNPGSEKELEGARRHFLAAPPAFNERGDKRDELPRNGGVDTMIESEGDGTSAKDLWMIRWMGTGEDRWMIRWMGHRRRDFG